ncbi:unnamed protein product [Colletotrichum noveboracense]|uniref:Uncharacterized protein n=1 Tax=Colletotrichum noveboracense TaxID=2664923 RepID=A0A9W4RT40_9PEZI|nr:unnamed protein product [Colletotrichum noveboracense]
MPPSYWSYRRSRWLPFLSPPWSSSNASSCSPSTFFLT